MYGIATDDSHYYHQFGPQFSNSGRGWVMVEARELTGNAIVEAMEEGKFYASTGVKLSNYRVKEGTISLTIEAEEGVTYKTSLIGVRKGRKKAEVFAIKGGAEVQLAIPNDVLFVRTKIVSSRLKENPFEEGDFETAWTQPVVPQGR